MRFSIFQDSRIGARKSNQDRVGYRYTREALLMVLADGLGGHQSGEVAAQLALQAIATSFQHEARPRLADPVLFLSRAILRSHAEIVARTANPKLADAPRTTLIACVVQDGRAWWSHIGDSRLYLVRKGRILARTRDHTRVQQLVDAGRIREEAVSAHPERNWLLQCLGGALPPQIEPAASARLDSGDIILLCSDGFWGPLTQRQLLAALVDKPVAQAVLELMALAETRAGPECDNVSAVAMRWGENPTAREDREDALRPAAPPRDVPTEVHDFGATEPDFSHQQMSDEDIEKAIAEIKAALRKHNPG